MSWCRCAAWLVVVTLGASACDDIEDLAYDAEQARGLRFATPVPMRHISRDDYAAEEHARVARISDGYLRAYADSYGRLGYFPLDLDLRPILATVNTGSVAAYYDPEIKAITLLGDSARDTIVHELVHGLQDQYFGVTTDGALMTTDEISARDAIIEGDATLAQLNYLAAEENLNFATVSLRMPFDRYTAFTESLLRDPATAPLFHAYAAFAYTFGLRYCAQTLTGASFERAMATRRAPFDWTLEDALFKTAAPRTSHGVLALQPAAPVAVGIDDVPASLAADFERIDWDSLGEWYTFLLLVPLEHCVACTTGDTRALVSGWAGDGALFVRQRSSGRVGVVWASAWADAGTAQRVAASLAELHGFVPNPVGDPSNGRAGHARDGEPMWLERRDQRVLVIKNIDAEPAAAFADAASPPGAAVRAAASGPRAPRSRPSLAALLRYRGSGRSVTVPAASSLIR